MDKQSKMKLLRSLGIIASLLGGIGLGTTIYKELEDGTVRDTWSQFEPMFSFNGFVLASLLVLTIVSVWKPGMTTLVQQSQRIQL